MKKMEDGDVSPLRTPSFVHHPHSMYNVGQYHKYPVTEKQISLNYQSQPAQNIPPHQPHMLLRKTLDRNCNPNKNPKRIIPHPIPLDAILEK